MFKKKQQRIKKKKIQSSSTQHHATGKSSKAFRHFPQDISGVHLHAPKQLDVDFGSKIKHVALYSWSDLICVNESLKILD